MEYEPFYWEDLEEGATPITAERLNHIEAGVAERQAGIPGPRGASAYDLAVEQGYDGSESEWLASLKGQPGNGSVDSVNGDNGPDIVIDAASVGAPTMEMFEDLEQRVLTAGALYASDFGVIGDGIVDDGPAVQAAVDASVGQRLIFNSGLKIRVGNSINLPSDVHLDFSGSEVIRAYEGVSAVIRMIGSQGVFIENLQLDGNGDEFPNDAPTGTKGYNLTAGRDVKNITYRNCIFRHVIDNHCIDISDSDNIRIINCSFLGFRTFGSRTFSEAVQLDVQGADGSGYGVNRNWLVNGCTFGPSDRDPQNWGGFGAGVGNHTSQTTGSTENVRITDNFFTGCNTSAVRISHMSKVLVDGNVFVDNERAVMTDPPTGQSNPSSYRCNDVVISNNVVEGRSSNTCFLVQWCDGFSLTGNVTRGGNLGVQLRYSRGGSVSGNTFQDPAAHGIMFNESGWDLAGSGQSSDLMVANNTVKRAGQSGISVSGVRRMLITGNAFIATSFSGTAVPCISLSGVQSAHVTGNYNHKSGGPVWDSYGLRATGSSDITSAANALTGSTANESI